MYSGLPPNLRAYFQELIGSRKSDFAIAKAGSMLNAYVLNLFIPDHSRLQANVELSY